MNTQFQKCEEVSRLTPIKLQKNFQPKLAIGKAVWKEDSSQHTRNFNKTGNHSLNQLVHLSIYLGNIFEVPIIYQVLLWPWRYNSEQNNDSRNQYGYCLVMKSMPHGIIRDYNGKVWIIEWVVKQIH